MHASVFLRAWGGARQRPTGGFPGSPGLRRELLGLGANIGEVRLEVAALLRSNAKGEELRLEKPLFLRSSAKGEELRLEKLLFPSLNAKGGKL